MCKGELMMDEKVKEMAERRRMMESAMASMRQEGFEYTQEEIEDFEKIIRGEMTSEEYRQKVLDHFKRLREEKPEKFYTEG
jgi:hypothetical protein